MNSVLTQEMRADESAATLSGGGAPAEEAVSAQLADSRALLESVQVQRFTASHPKLHTVLDRPAMRFLVGISLDAAFFLPSLE